MLQLVRALAGLGSAPRRRPSAEFLLDTDRFELAATAERMRVDRNGSVVSLLAIELAASKSSQREIQEFSGLMASRLRLTDTAGWLRDGRLGVLLPDTPEAGAWKVAADLCESFQAGVDRPDCEVIVYPESDGGSGSDDGTRGPDSGEEAPHLPKRARHERGAATDDSGELAGVSPLNGVTRIDVAHSTKRRRKTDQSSFDLLFSKPLPLWKRSLDIVGATVGLVIASPVILTAAAVVKLTSPGPAFFVQPREGLGGRRFSMYKIRSMRQDAEELKASLLDSSEQDGPAFKMAADPRITPVGRLIRKTSIDELPQLWNVLRGDMSLVGPRPLPVTESLACQPWQRRRLHITPGITCTWQIYGRNVVPFDDWIRMDLAYAERRTPWVDLALVAKTGSTLIKRKGQ